ncbi:hypothetical protein PSPO01_06370 [Paraphaeosphaeria sporulosa]
MWSQKPQARGSRLNTVPAVARCSFENASCADFGTCTCSLNFTLGSTGHDMDKTQDLAREDSASASGRKLAEVECESAIEDLNGSEPTWEDPGDYHISRLFETDQKEEPSPNDNSGHEPVHRRCGNYQSLSKSAKRRVRRGVKAEEMRSRHDDPPAIRLSEEKVFDWFHVGEVQQGMSLGRIHRWRKRRLSRKANPFVNCVGEFHHFDCRHIFKVLCKNCAQGWRAGHSCFAPCISTMHKSDHLHFKQPCPHCLKLPAEKYLARKKLIKGTSDPCRDLVDYLCCYLSADGTRNHALHDEGDDMHGKREVYLITDIQAFT